MRWEQQQQQKETEPLVKRRKTGDITAAAPPLLYQLLELVNENFARQFFVGLGPMELMNLYRTSRRLRFAMTDCLAECLLYILDRLRPEAVARGNELQLRLYRTIVDRSTVTLQLLCNRLSSSSPQNDTYHFMIPPFLEMVHLIHCQVRLYSTETARYCTNATDKVIPELTFLVSDEPRWRVAPLTSANVFVATADPRVTANTVATRLSTRFGQTWPVANDTAWNSGPALFRHQDWIDTELHQLGGTGRCVRWGPLRLPPHRLFLIDEQRCAITQLREPPYVPGRLSLDECQLAAVNQAETDLYALELGVIDVHQFISYAAGLETNKEPVQPFFDYYELRLAAEARSQPLVDAQRRAEQESQLQITTAADDDGGVARVVTPRERRLVLDAAWSKIGPALSYQRLAARMESVRQMLAQAVNHLAAQSGLPPLDADSGDNRHIFAVQYAPPLVTPAPPPVTYTRIHDLFTYEYPLQRPCAAPKVVLCTVF